MVNTVLRGNIGSNIQKYVITNKDLNFLSERVHGLCI